MMRVPAYIAGVIAKVVDCVHMADLLLHGFSAVRVTRYPIQMNGLDLA